MPQIAFIGAGRLCTTLATALQRLGCQVSAIASRDPARAQALADALPGCRATGEQEAAQADLVFLTVPDDAIAPTAERLPWRGAGQWVVHCSGATEVSALHAAAQAGALTGGFHPLLSFADPAGALERLAGSTVAIEAPEPLAAHLHQLAAQLGLHPLALPPGARGLYHGGASFAASFLLSMLDEAAATWRAFGIAEADALRALLPMAHGILDAAARQGLAGALSGPISRGDAQVVDRHLQALAPLGAEHTDFYRELSRRQLDLARRSGRLSPEALDRLRQTLDAGH